MECITIAPRTYLFGGVALLAIYALSFFLPGSLAILGAPAIFLIVLLVVIRRYLSKITLESRRMHRISEFTFYGALAAIVGAYTIFVIMDSTLGDVLFVLGMGLFSLYIMIPGLVEQLAENQTG